MERASETPESLTKNFWLFCIFYAIIHGAVDAVLAFSAAELGTDLGSMGGTVLYAFYTCSALLIAKPCLQIFDAKSTVFFGLMGLLIYVAGFFLAILFPVASKEFFLSGCAIGGIGAGLLWTGQGSYYTLNASYFASVARENRSQALTRFAGIFAGTYLSFETLYKFIGTFIFLVVGASSSGSWQPVLFGIYTASAFISTVFFWTNIQSFKDDSILLERDIFSSHHSDISDDAHLIPQRRRLLSDEKNVLIPPPEHALGSNSQLNKQSHTYLEVPVNSTDGNPSNPPDIPSDNSKSWRSVTQGIVQDMLVVGKTMCSVRKLQLLIPYQVCFGLSAGLVDTYVNGVIVKTYIGTGYIGVLSGIVTLSAALLAAPFVVIGNMKQGAGKDWIMIAGGVCFALGGLMLLVLTDAQIAHWAIIISYYVFHGAARGVWENTNKAIVSEMFEHSPGIRDAAFATVYFSSGLAGAMGFAFFQFLSKRMIALINLLISGIAVFSYIVARKLHRRELRVREVRQMVSALDTDDGDDDDDYEDKNIDSKNVKRKYVQKKFDQAEDGGEEVEVYFSPLKDVSPTHNPMRQLSESKIV